MQILATHGSAISLAAINDMEYLDASIREALRLMPAANGQFRRALKDVRVSPSRHHHAPLAARLKSRSPPAHACMPRHAPALRACCSAILRHPFTARHAAPHALHASCPAAPQAGAYTIPKGSVVYWSTHLPCFLDNAVIAQNGGGKGGMHVGPSGLPEHMDFVDRFEVGGEGRGGDG